ncbi:hypothetical protein LOD99_7256 [Oopsacas minuta]|uniref:Uncharacterized protein n=1 Tax=Oopsacas minuta TaxID=111878 RepID=A0AAV7JUS2_9METZ|nr:hypothetical protein LOD99_7256 [Oopsacas minuta]
MRYIFVLLFLWIHYVYGWAPVYYSSTVHDYSGIYSVVLKRSAPPSSRECLIRKVKDISQGDEFKLIAKSHKTHLGFTARLSQNLLSLVMRSHLVFYIQEDHVIRPGQSYEDCASMVSVLGSFNRS